VRQPVVGHEEHVGCVEKRGHPGQLLAARWRTKRCEEDVDRGVVIGRQVVVERPRDLPAARCELEILVAVECVAQKRVGMECRVDGLDRRRDPRRYVRPEAVL